jgi:hypothetical protein
VSQDLSLFVLKGSLQAAWTPSAINIYTKIPAMFISVFTRGKTCVTVQVAQQQSNKHGVCKCFRRAYGASNSVREYHSNPLESDVCSYTHVQQGHISCLCPETLSVNHSMLTLFIPVQNTE